MFAALGPGGLTQASGEAATGSQQTTFNAMNLFIGLLTDPFIAGRGDGVASSGGAPQFADERCAMPMRPTASHVRRASATPMPRSIARRRVAESFAQRWSVWAAGYGGSQTTDGNAALGSNTATSSIYGTAVGADYRFSPFTLAGFALAGGGTNFSIANGLGGGRSDLFQAGAFVRHNVGPAYISAALAYGWQDITTDRTVTIAGVDQLRAKFNANAWSGRVEGGYRFVTPWRLRPDALCGRTVHHLRAAGLCRDGGHRRQHVCAGLCRQERHGDAAANSDCVPTNHSRCRTRS